MQPQPPREFPASQTDPASYSHPPLPGSPSVLAYLRRKQNDDAIVTWVMVGLLCLSIWSGLSWATVSSFMSIYGRPGLIGYLILICAVVFCLPALLAYSAWQTYNRQARTVAWELVHGGTALMLIDESYGRLLEELRREHYSWAFNEVPPGKDFVTRFNHFAMYYPYYQRIAAGAREFRVRPATQLSCWRDGVITWCIGPNCPLLIVLMLVRIIGTYPRVLATKQAVLDFLSGNLDHELEQAYQGLHGEARPSATAGG